MTDNMLPSPWQSGFRGKCPRCAEGRLYMSFLKVADRCAVCDLDLSKEDAGDGAVPFIVLIVGAMVAGVGIWIGFTFDPPLWVTIPILGSLTLVLVLGTLPKVKGLLIALQYLNKAGDTGLNTFED